MNVVSTDSIKFVDLTYMMPAIGTIAFAFVCHDCAFLFFSSLRNPTKKRWARLTHIAVFSALVACLMLAVCGYFTFYEDTQSNILNNYPAHDVLVIVVRFAFCTKTCEKNSNIRLKICSRNVPCCC